ncbi:hemolymph lipopolysaccharide-binding protein-like [Zootermopsis nevadensis]|uniref:Hemolymph lipopolysaccharide-binding protein n=1 Tax=Zootermopsis nevadensis TaxID=136037 RepID=A0A067R9L2_ZOONE|nr:hemolymph lipopolysaccharide-binding protein-like [Zootermopsis nevadensis]KDR20371.1 Hemolymph lipopolysaccharide-binding protein [Zootermopsis nevadensis]
MSQFMLIWSVLWWINIATGQQCSSYQHETVKLVIKSQRNNTGHWVAQVSLNHGAYQHEEGPWELDVDHSVEKCDEEESVHLVATIAVPPRHIHVQYKLLPDLGYYRFHDVPVTWYKAVITCTAENGHLLILNSPKEFTELKKIWDASGVKGDFLHIGINDFDKEAVFVTVLGDSLNSTGYAPWGPNEPNSGATANCGALKRTGELHDSYCSNQFPFFCEKNLF